MDKKVLKALNDQVAKEVFSSYLYLQMAAWYEERNLKGFASWMRVQAQEEAAHAMIFFNYLAHRGVKITLGAIDAPKSDYTSNVNVFEETLKHEKFITASIYGIMDVALAAKDYPTVAMLNWFVTEQVEEEANADEWVRKLTMVGDNNPGLLVLDAQAATRQFVMPAPLQAAAQQP